MFKIESYVTPILLSYVDKYVRDFKPGDAQVSLWGGGVALHNLVLKTDVLQQEVSLPFTLVSGRIHELLIQVPWTKIMSEPIVVTIDTIECVLNQHQPVDSPPPEPPSRKTQVLEAPPGYMQALVRRIVSNIALRVHHLIVKYVHDDIVMSLNVKHLAVDSAGASWEPTFADIDQNQPLIRRLVGLDDFTLCLDKADADGKIRFYQEPLLYRCRLDLRVLTYLVSANTRRASSIAVQLCSSKLAWSVTSDQLALLLRLVMELGAAVRAKPQPTAPNQPKQPKQPATQPPSQTSTKAHSSTEPARSGSWSDWAWSWLPSVSDKEGGVEDVPATPTPLPLSFDAYLDDVSLVFKVIEVEGQTRKRFRSVLEMNASFAAVKIATCLPTSIRLQFGARNIELRSFGKCLCGFNTNEASGGKPMMYLKRILESESSSERWQWPEESLQFGPASGRVEAAEAADEEQREPTETPEGGVEQEQAQQETPPQSTSQMFELDDTMELLDDTDVLWDQMSPVLLIRFLHVRSPPEPATNPYDHPPKYFQYSDWVEECRVKVTIQPVQFRVTLGLMHRLSIFKEILNEISSVPPTDIPMRVLTIEECEALNDNMPERRISVEAQGLQVQLLPWDHTLLERPAQVPLLLALEVPKIQVSITGPLYPHRMCSAACQMPQYVGPLWQASRLNVSVSVYQAQLRIATVSDDKHKPCARTDLRLVVHILLNKSYFSKRECEFLSCSVKINEMNICGSAARLQAAWHLVQSVMRGHLSLALKHSSLPKDALNDEEAVAVDFTLEGLVIRGFRTKNLTTYIVVLNSAKATVYHGHLPGKVKQAWIFSAPDLTTAKPYLRVGLQWCDQPSVETLEYVGVWAEPTAVSVDPLLIMWLAYTPALITKSHEATPSASSIVGKSAPYTLRKRTPSSSGRGGSRSGGSAEQVHRPRASTVSSEPSDKRITKATQQSVEEQWWQGERLVALHQRLRSMLISVEVGLVQVYVTTSTASALDCATLRGAMERHAVAAHKVVAFSLGRLTIISNAGIAYLWDDVRNDGPTILKKRSDLESFPWRLCLADVSCYTLEPQLERLSSDVGIRRHRSSLKEQPTFAIPRTVLELVTTTLTVSVVTKSLQIKNINLIPPPKKDKSSAAPTLTEYKTRYFASGQDFRPTTLQEFFRGPRRSTIREIKEQQKQEEARAGKAAQTAPTEEVTVTTGPIVSLGVHLHADTPPIIIKLMQDQVHIIAAAIHCFNHIISLIKQESTSTPKAKFSVVGLQKIPSTSQMEEAHTVSEDTRSKSSDIIEIFDRTASVAPRKLSTFFWFQWVVSRAALVVASSTVKLAFDVDDIITTVDIQAHYKQLKVKVAAASVRHYEKESDWVPGVLGGRVIEAREMIGAKDEDHFFGVTITLAQISELPSTWKQELHPKLLEQQNGDDSMWEIYATLAPLEVIIQPVILDNVASLVAEMAPRSSCPLKQRETTESAPWQLPFIYMTAGGLRLLITGQDTASDKEDAFVLHFGRVTVNPHPENPICRRSVNAPVDGGWLGATTNLEGRQYEINMRHLAVRSACFTELILEESRELLKNMNENPALKWDKQVDPPTVTPLLYPLDICCVLAPALYIGGLLTCGPAVEVNLISDCAIEISVQQAVLCQHLIRDIAEGYERESMLFDYGKADTCPYAGLVKTSAPDGAGAEPAALQEFGRSIAEDSGVETLASTTTSKTRTLLSEELTFKKSVSILLSEQTADASEYLEVFVTMGSVHVTLQVEDDGSAELAPLRPPSSARADEPPSPAPKPQRRASMLVQEKQTLHEGTDPTGSIRSLTEKERDADVMSNGGTGHYMDLNKFIKSMPLLTVTLQQPNLYYWRKKGLKNIQASMFDIWVGLGKTHPGHWNAVLVTTAKGAPDPVTDVPPALATLNIIAPVSNSQFFTSNIRGNVRLDVERPIQLEVCCDRIRRLRAIYALLDENLNTEDSDIDLHYHVPLLYRIRQTFFQNCIESMIVSVGQVAVCGTEGSVGWDSASCQLAAGGRPERLVARALVTALAAAAGPAHDIRHVVLQPLMLGAQMEATWETWRRAEGQLWARTPAVRVGIDLDRVVVDLRPAELAACLRLQQHIQQLFPHTQQPPHVPPKPSGKTMYRTQFEARSSLIEILSGDLSRTSIITDTSNQYYKDDLRSGAFKILEGGQLPMAYQVMLNGNTVSWRYPHPRAITRIVAFPLPGADTETKCVLELFTPILDKWEPHTYFDIPVGEPREIQLYVPPPDAVFATMWRFRTCGGPCIDQPEYQFDMNNYTPRTDPLTLERNVEDACSRCKQGVTAEQLSGVLRVDSNFAPHLLSGAHLVMRLVLLEVHVHNDLPKHSSMDTALEGYYVSRPLMRSHRVLSLLTRNAKLHGQLGSPAGVLYVLDTTVRADVIDSSTGTMEELVSEFRVQAGLSASSAPGRGARARVCASVVRVALNVPRLRACRALFADWRDAVDKYHQAAQSNEEAANTEAEGHKQMGQGAAPQSAAALEGRVALWVHNTCTSALRIGQEGTDEVVPLGPMVNLAYRWRAPLSPKRLRFALADPSANWHWSSSIPFAVGSRRVRLEDVVSSGKKGACRSVSTYVHVRVEELGGKRVMHLSGTLLLANMLRLNLLYKVRLRCVDSGQWRTLCSGELPAEQLGISVISNVEAEMVLKIKLTSHDTGWSGDIPLKECPKENVPWLVKVPSDGELSFLSVWCRVTRARHDGRTLATVWPLYVLHSHLPLDTDVLIVTDSGTSKGDTTLSTLAPMVQSTPGRGTSTHLLAPGTTANKHSLSFQYRNIECPVTREAVPMHYGVTDASVFDKRLPVSHINEVMQEIIRWLEWSGRHANSDWPYSIVSKHWSGPWRAALLQPRCDVTVRYRAVNAGGGCSLNIQLCPIVLFCNAVPVALTLRSYDASPLCRLEPGTAISPPSPVLTKPFYISMEVGRETFVSEPLQLSTEEPGRYGALPPGRVALEHDAQFAIVCNQKVALLTMYYEIKHEINILGVSSTFVLINRLDTAVLASPIAVPADENKDFFLIAKTFKVVQPTKADSIHGTSLSQFWLRGRWKGGAPLELRTYLLLALPADTYPARTPAPVRLGAAPVRRALALLDKDGVSVPITVTQIKHESRWLVVIAYDPCPQFVVQNHTRLSMLVAEPVPIPPDHPPSSYISPVSECRGATWWCKVRPETAMHYSTPAHCARYPPSAAAPAVPSAAVPLLTFGKKLEEGTYEWCPPVAAADGEQLLQFYGGVIKLRVHTHPHSTLLQLMDTDQDDISPSDIRRRLHGAVSEELILPLSSTVEPLLDRTYGNYKIFGNHSKLSINVDTETDEVLSKDVSSTAITTPTSEHRSRESSVTFTDPVKSSSLTKDSECQVHYEMSDGSDYNVSQPSLAARGTCSDVMAPRERLRLAVAGLQVELSASPEEAPLLALHVDRSAVLVVAEEKATRTIISVADIQVDNMQYESGQFDFAVVASTRAEPLPPVRWPALWNVFGERDAFRTNHKDARLLIKLLCDQWTYTPKNYSELTEIEIQLGSLALYVEDAYVKALIDLSRRAWPTLSPPDAGPVLAEERALRRPLRLRRLHVHPLDLTLTLHTAVRMYIALDQSPLRLSAFELHDMMTSAEQLTHALTVHYLSAAILGAGWVVGGLELLGAPGALAARLGGATGGVKGVASATAAALLRSLSAWAGSLARNLDLLAGDEEHARRAAAARRRPPPSLLAGLVAGLTNFAINILGAVGGLAHHPLVGVAVGETESSAAALRRGLLGALTKPLSATADLVAYAGQGLLHQTGWDPVPKPRRAWGCAAARDQGGWRRDCVRWVFRLADMYALAGYEVLLDGAPLQLLLTHKFLVVAEPESERIVEMIDFRCCTLKPYSGQIIELSVRTQRRSSRALDARAFNEEDEYQISAAAMARVARYTGSEGAGAQPEVRVLTLMVAPSKSQSLHAALIALIHHNVDTHLSLL